LELRDNSDELPTVGLKEARQAAELRVLQNVLRKHGGKVLPAAAELGVSRTTFYELMDKLGIPRQ